MFVTWFNYEDTISERELIVFRDKPNMILYWIESTRSVILGMLCMDVGLVILLYIAKHASIIFLIELTALLNVILFTIFMFAFMLATLKLEFLITKHSVVVRYSPFGVGRRSQSIPIADIAGIELRTYGPRYGSVYLEQSKVRRSSVPAASVSDASAWTALSWNWPPMIGFYGFEKYHEFANVIVRLRAETHAGLV